MFLSCKGVYKNRRTALNNLKQTIICNVYIYTYYTIMRQTSLQHLCETLPSHMTRLANPGLRWTKRNATLGDLDVMPGILGRNRGSSLWTFASSRSAEICCSLKLQGLMWFGYLPGPVLSHDSWNMKSWGTASKVKTNSTNSVQMRYVKCKYYVYIPIIYIYINIL
jgi:hypothetical protein